MTRIINVPFVKYDIKEFYPSITEKTLDKALELSKEYISVPLDKIEVIKHCCKTLLYYDDSIWIKKGASGNFDTPMGSFDGAEICELVGCLLLYNINYIVDPYSHGLYRDDGLIILGNSTPRKFDIRKKLHRLFNGFGFKLEIQTNLKITDYLDITLNLYNGTVSPFRKQNQNPCYVNMGSNHPIQVFKHIPNGIEHRLSTNSSNIDIFEQSKRDYEKALKDNGYNVKLSYKINIEISNTHKRKK